MGFRRHDSNTLFRLIPVFGILSRLAKFLLMEYTESAHLITYTEIFCLCNFYAKNQPCLSPGFMTKLTIQVRTSDNLIDLLKAQQSGYWTVAQGKEQEISNIQIVNFDGTQRIEAEFNLEHSHRVEDGRLLIAFTNACIRNCRVSFDSRNPVRYI